MNPTVIEMSFLVSVENEAKLRKSAFKQALKDGLSRDEANEYLSEADSSIMSCLQMVLDPGSIDGCNILDVRGQTK